ncbi:MAG: pectinesterase family protein, partial [Candidatus Hodarchaeales archaeon]
MKTHFISGLIILIFIVTPFTYFLKIQQIQADPAIIYVDDDGTADYTTIQEAINAANSGDTIIVKEGIYTENIIVDKSNLNIESENGFNNTIIRSNTTYTTVRIIRDYVNITGFTISRDFGDGNSAGIIIEQARYCRISLNNVINNDHGIRIIGFYNLIENNTLLNDLYDILFSYSAYNELKKNFMLKGIGISGNALGYFTHDIDSTNTVNNKPLYYIYQKNGYTVPEGAGQIIVVNSSNVLVENQEISNIFIAIRIESSSNININSNVLKEDFRGIYIENSINTQVLNNTVVYSKSYFSQESGGIQLGYGSNNSIANNDISHNYNGIYTYSEIGGIISNNTFDNNTFGIQTSSKNATILLNNISNCRITGIHLSSSGSDNNLIVKNNFLSNQHAIDESNPGHNIIYLNNFIENGVPLIGQGSASLNSPSQANYNYKGKTYTFKVGNYWTEYSGIDTDGNGIAEEAFTVVGNKIDYYPLIEPIENYNIIHELEANDTGTWYVDSDGTVDFRTIQEAVNSVNYGDSIIVKEGIYIENIEVKK